MSSGTVTHVNIDRTLSNERGTGIEAEPTRKPRRGPAISKLLSNYGMLGVLLALCLYFSWATLNEQQPVGRDAGEAVANVLASTGAKSVAIVIKGGTEDLAFADAVSAAAGSGGYTVVGRIQGDPRGVRQGLETLVASGATIDAVATTSDVANWGLMKQLGQAVPGLGAPAVVVAEPYVGSDFLKPDNLRNVLNQIVVIAITAVGMTMVIITAGIDLSVGSLIALSAVGVSWLIRAMGGAEASVAAMIGCSVIAIAGCGLVGTFSGFMITRFKIPPFIATLGVMQIASGLAYMIAEGQSIYQIPDGFTWLGRGADLMLIPNAVLLMAMVYLVGHVVMSKTSLGRYVYAVGGNPEAARLSGVRVSSVLLLVYTLSGLAAGVGGVVLASQLKSGAPTYGMMYELYVIAAVVVGGTSLAGGEGRIMGTLIGALIIAVIQNGMNLTGVESYTQKVVLGAVILGAVLLDMLRRHGWRSVLRPA